MSAICKQNGCDKPCRKVGLCPAHYRRMRLGQDMSAPIRPWRGDPVAGFWEKVQKSEGCWEWTAWRDKKGYGRYRSSLAHRLAYELSGKPIPDGLLLDHICHNRACVNPDHLRPVTAEQNQANRSGANKSSKSGIRGVSWVKRDQVWKAETTANHERHSLGRFETAEEAEAAVTEWRRINMPYSLMDQKKAD